MLSDKQRAFKAWKKLNDEEKTLLLIATQKYDHLYNSGLAPWIEVDDFIKREIWKRFLSDNRIGVA